MDNDPKAAQEGTDPVLGATPEVKENPQEIASKLQRRIESAMATPVPSPENTEWQISSSPLKKASGGWLPFLKKKKVNDDAIAELRRNAKRSPGSTRGKVIDLLKKYPDNPDLYVLSAICTFGMLTNASTSDSIIDGLKSAAKDAATALIHDGISLYNAEQFFSIYFTFLEKMKKEQVRVYSMLRADPRLHVMAKKIVIKMREVDSLLVEKRKAEAILAHLKKKTKTSNFTHHITLEIIRMAASYVEQDKGKDNFGIGTAQSTVAAAYALSSTFARIPVLTPLIEQILNHFPESNLGFQLRKFSIRNSLQFTNFKILMARGETEKMKSLSRAIFKGNVSQIERMGQLSIHQPYEADPFLNLAIITEASFGLLARAEHTTMVEKALHFIKFLMSNDMSKQGRFTETAKVHSFKLISLLKEDGSSKDTVREHEKEQRNEKQGI